MSLSEKVGQLIVAPVCPIHGEGNLQNMHKFLKEREIGNIILMSGTSDVQREFIQGLQDELDNPLVAFQDAEWGVGMRLRDVPNLPKNLTLGAIQDLDLLRAFGLELARQCRMVGIMGNFAPVADVNTNPKNPVIHRRSFGADPHQVAKRALAVMEGMQAGGLWACAKHFPGHGDTIVDSHHTLPLIDKGLWQIEQNELIPFKLLIDNGIDMVMVGHLAFPQLSREPSSLSKEIITGLLRNQMGFEGVVVSDALNMKALLEDPEENAIKALLAGCDLLVYATANPSKNVKLIEETIPRVIERIKKEIPEALIDEKVERIQKMKEKRMTELPQENPQLRRTLYRHAVTCIGGLPAMGEEVALVQSHPDPDFEHFLSRYAHLKLFSFEEIEKAGQYPFVIVNVRKGDFPTQIPSHAVLALFDSPYSLYPLSYSHALVGYEDEVEVKEAISDVLFGQFPPLGKLPIPLCRVEGGSYGREGSERKDKIRCNLAGLPKL